MLTYVLLLCRYSSIHHYWDRPEETRGTSAVGRLRKKETVNQGALRLQRAVKHYHSDLPELANARPNSGFSDK